MLALAVLSGGAVALGGTAAQAASYTCVHSKSITVYNTGGVSHVVMTAHWQCSDGNFHASGTLYDDKCDAREAHLVMTANGVLLPDGQDDFYDQWEYQAWAGNGCGTHSSFTVTRPAVEIGPNSTQGDVQILVGACSTTCSDYTQYILLITYTGGGGGCITPARHAAVARMVRTSSVIPC